MSERLSNFGTKINIFFKKYFFENIKKIVFIFFSLLLRNPKKLNNIKDNTILNIRILQIYVSLIIINNSNRKILEIL